MKQKELIKIIDEWVCEDKENRSCVVMLSTGEDKNEDEECRNNTATLIRGSAMLNARGMGATLSNPDSLFRKIYELGEMFA